MNSDLSVRKYRTEDLVGEIQRRIACGDKPKKNIILIGPAGAGKGTQAEKIRDEFCLCHLSTGDLLREAVTKGTETGKKAKPIMDAGKLVPDDIVIDLINEAMDRPDCTRGMILDGFPRNTVQANKLDAMLTEKKKKIDKVLQIHVDDEELIERIEGRRVHPSSGRTYHVKFQPPKVAGKDDVTGEPLIQRKDDTAEVLKARLDSFRKETMPILDFYQKRGLTAKVDGTGKKIKDVWAEVTKIL